MEQSISRKIILSPTIHDIPEYMTCPNDFIVWLGIAPRRYMSTRVFNYTPTNLYCDARGRHVHIGNVGVYHDEMIPGRNLTFPRFNLFIYIPLTKLYSIRIHELYTNYLHVCKDPYYVYLNHQSPERNYDVGTIQYQIQKLALATNTKKPII